MHLSSFYRVEVGSIEFDIWLSASGFYFISNKKNAISNMNLFDLFPKIVWELTW